MTEEQHLVDQSGGVAPGAGRRRDWNGRDQILAAQAMGAQAVRLGSFWLNSSEADAEPAQREFYRNATSVDNFRLRSFTGKTARMLKNEWTEAWKRDDTPDPLPMPLQGYVGIGHSSWVFAMSGYGRHVEPQRSTSGLHSRSCDSPKRRLRHTTENRGPVNMPEIRQPRTRTPKNVTRASILAKACETYLAGPNPTLHTVRCERSRQARNHRSLTPNQPQAEMSTQ